MIVVFSFLITMIAFRVLALPQNLYTTSVIIQKDRTSHFPQYKIKSILSSYWKFSWDKQSISKSTKINLQIRWKMYLLVFFIYASGACPEIVMLVSRLVQTEIWWISTDLQGWWNWITQLCWSLIFSSHATVDIFFFAGIYRQQFWWIAMKFGAVS